jgi:hypothetical protein
MIYFEILPTELYHLIIYKLKDKKTVLNLYLTYKFNNNRNFWYTLIKQDYGFIVNLSCIATQINMHT